MKALNGPCILGKPHQCLQENLNVNENICEREIVLLESTKSCEHVKLEIKENLFEFISDINQYLAVFPNKEILRIESLDHNEIKELQGVFLVEPSKVETVETGSVNIELPSVAPTSPRLYPDISPLGNARI
ncbi:hypothetical protein M8J77_008167 [Diaphorina citri]|nr:hypothetical protein M8J77_020996 [Diaphorina citri]KAI5751514.1 hypothetical protein M8J77_008167 [Diaphorina citri]